MKALLFLFLLLLSFSVEAAEPCPVALPANPFTGSRLFQPNDELKHTSIVMLHGSEGGSTPYVDAEAAVLATQGFNVLVLCYFDCGRALNGPRAMLKNVEASTVLDAVAWMRSQKSNNGTVVLYGFSRGAELTMIAGGLDGTPAQTPDALIAHSPSDVFNGPVSWDWFEPACWLCRKASCPQGSPNSDFYWNPSCGEANNPALVDFSLSAWLVNGKPVASGTRIPIEKFSGPVLLTVGLKDELWPADQTKRIESTLRAVGTPVEAHYFPEGGHVLHGQEEMLRRELVLDFLRRL